MTAQPFVKWAGGKRQLLDELVKYVPKRIRRYYEPFVGGGALFFRLADEQRFETASISDSCSDLVNAYRTVASDRYRLAEQLRALEALYEKTPEETYYRVRAENPKELNIVDRAARFIFLNKAGFNGLYRLNKKGGFNVPWGKRDVVTTHDAENLKRCSSALAQVSISLADFESSVAEARAGDFVYFDPPYMPTSKTSSFVAYSQDGFNADAQKRLANVFVGLALRGVDVMLSQADVPEARELYAGAHIVEVEGRRAVNCQSDKRGKVGELIVLARRP